MARAVVATRRPLRSIGLRLAPTTRCVAITTDDDRIERYIRTSYAELAVRHVPREGSDRAVLSTATSPPAATFNGLPMPRPRPEDTSDPWNSGGYVVDQFLWRSLARDPDWFSLYGCAASLNGGAVAIVGPSGSGKTTLGLALALHGARLYGDEFVVIHRRDRRVTSVSRRLRVRDGTASLLGDDGVSAIVRRDGRIEDAAPPAPLRLLTILGPPEGTPHVRPLSHARAALRVAPYFAARPGDMSEIDAFVRILQGVQTFELCGRDPRAAAALIAEALA